MILEDAKRCADMGLSVIPLNGKVPCIADWPKKATKDVETLREWFSEGLHNIGLPTGKENGLVVLDFDEKEKAREFFKTWKNMVGCITETRRGIHMYFSYPDFDVGNSSDREAKIDVRGKGGQVVYPHSMVGEHIYRFVEGYELDPRKLTPFRREWLPEKKTPSGGIHPNDSILGRISRARKYVEKCEGAVAGEGGHNQTFRIACKLVRQPPNGFGLTIEQAWPLMLAYNARCEPSWSEDELIHKLSDAALKG